MLKIENLSAFYGKKQVLFDLSFELERGKFTAILGRNGSGKSSLLSCIGGIKSYSGKILLGEREISEILPRERAKMLSYLPQNLPLTQFTVLETVAFGREPYTSFKLSEADIEIIEKSIEKCGISHLKNKKLTEISGGERQMAYLAMTLAQDADVIMLDEPTTYMDAPNAREFLSTLKSAQSEGKTVVAVMHDLTQAVKYADNIILIDAGRIIFAGTRKECIESGEIERVMGVEKHSLDDGAVVFI
jgi:iron complex transport system ATP-binding protein